MTKNKPLTAVGIWLGAFSFTLIIHRWLKLDPEFMFFIWSLVFTAAVMMVLTGLGVFSKPEQ